MNEFYQEADGYVRRAVERLSRVLSQDGEDISCYTGAALDESIMDLIKARSRMSIGWYIDEKNGEPGHENRNRS